MELKDFIIGEIYTLDSSYGVFLGKNPNYPSKALFKWIHNPNNWAEYGLNIIGRNLCRMTHGKPKPPMTPKERIALRCKTLWNNSNWVKQHPHQAY